MIEQGPRISGYESGAAPAYAGAVVTKEISPTPELSGRKLHLVKKALAIAVASIQRMPESPFRSDSDMADMRDLLDEMIESDEELAHYARSARIALAGRPD